MTPICDTCTANNNYSPARMKECHGADYKGNSQGDIVKCTAYVVIQPDTPMGLDACDSCKNQEITTDPYDTGDNWLRHYECNAGEDTPEEGRYCDEWEEK